MLRPFSLLPALLLAVPALAQTPPNAMARPSDCLVRTSAAPASWMIQGHDPFSDQYPEGTFSVTFVNEGGSECRFTPAFELTQPPFGLSTGSGKRLGYEVRNLADFRDVTPRAGRSFRQPSDRELILAPNESKTLLYKFAVNSDDVREAGIFTQDVTILAQDRGFRSFGGTQIVLGLEVLPSARIGLAGAYSMNNGQAVVDLGELRTGLVRAPLRLGVNSTGSYDLQIVSANSGKLRMGSTEWMVPYTVSIGGHSVNLAGTSVVSSPTGTRHRRDSLPIQFVIGDVSDQRAGTYSDVISISVTAR